MNHILSDGNDLRCETLTVVANTIPRLDVKTERLRMFSNM